MAIYQFFNYACPVCDTVIERMVDRKKKDEQYCDTCNNIMNKLPPAPRGKGNAFHGYLKSGRGFN